MTLLPWRQKDVGLAVADEITRQNVERAMSVMHAYKSYDYKRGYQQGRSDTIWIAVAIVLGLTGLGAVLVAVLS